MYTAMGNPFRFPYFRSTLFREGALARTDIASYQERDICIDPLDAKLKGYGL
jgi:hypothetical protein